ncbi:MAG: LPXTG cell wall anchor domain-containing protein [Coriobacteriia bacterium]|nr:LPXTG cell wall anchor domain-containing protein [Coriobacteriia bacterium]
MRRAKAEAGIGNTGDTVIPKKSDPKTNEEKEEKGSEKKDAALPKTGDEPPSAALSLADGFAALALIVLAKRRDA